VRVCVCVCVCVAADSGTCVHRAQAWTAPARTAMLNSISAFSAFPGTFLPRVRAGYVFDGSSCIGNCSRACHSTARSRWPRLSRCDCRRKIRRCELKSARFADPISLSLSLSLFRESLHAGESADTVDRDFDTANADRRLPGEMFPICFRLQERDRAAGSNGMICAPCDRKFLLAIFSRLLYVPRNPRFGSRASPKRFISTNRTNHRYLRRTLASTRE